MSFSRWLVRQKFSPRCKRPATPPHAHQDQAISTLARRDARHRANRYRQDRRPLPMLTMPRTVAQNAAHADPEPTRRLARAGKPSKIRRRPEAQRALIIGGVSFDDQDPGAHPASTCSLRRLSITRPLSADGSAHRVELLVTTKLTACSTWASFSTSSASASSCRVHLPDLFFTATMPADQAHPAPSHNPVRAGSSAGDHGRHHQPISPGPAASRTTARYAAPPPHHAGSECHRSATGSARWAAPSLCCAMASTPRFRTRPGSAARTAALICFARARSRC